MSQRNRARGTPSGFPRLRRPPLPFIEAPRGGRMVPRSQLHPPRPRTSRIGALPPQGLAEKAGGRRPCAEHALVGLPSPAFAPFGLDLKPLRFQGFPRRFLPDWLRGQAQRATPLFLPLADRLGALLSRQGPGLRPSPSRPVSSPVPGCGPHQPGFRPLTRHPLEHQGEPRRARWRGRPSRPVTGGLDRDG